MQVNFVPRICWFKEGYLIKYTHRYFYRNIYVYVLGLESVDSPTYSTTMDRNVWLWQHPWESVWIIWDKSLKIKHLYLRSHASTYLSLSSTSPVISQIRDITLIEILVLTSWISHPRILYYWSGELSVRQTHISKDSCIHVNFVTRYEKYHLKNWILMIFVFT